ncbi:MAG TPA: hypothetical protein VFX98_08375 [Longimicrobiaceae bacterium]|nr:hypothetical protein [Longimicrobiaceae bacterium]
MHRYGHDYDDDRNFLERAGERVREWFGRDRDYDRDYGFRGQGMDRDPGMSRWGGRGWNEPEGRWSGGYRGTGGYGRTEWGGGGYGGYDRDFGGREWSGGYRGGGMEHGRGGGWEHERGSGRDREEWNRGRMRGGMTMGGGMRGGMQGGGRGMPADRDLHDYGSSLGGDVNYGTERYRSASGGGVPCGGYFRGYGVGTRHDYDW